MKECSVDFFNRCWEKVSRLCEEGANLLFIIQAGAQLWVFIFNNRVYNIKEVI